MYLVLIDIDYLSWSVERFFSASFYLVLAAITLIICKAGRIW